MKELSVIEMESISGAYSWDFSSLGSAISSIASNGVEAVASALLLGAIKHRWWLPRQRQRRYLWRWYHRYDDRWALWHYRWRN